MSTHLNMYTYLSSTTVPGTAGVYHIREYVLHEDVTAMSSGNLDQGREVFQ